MTNRISEATDLGPANYCTWLSFPLYECVETHTHTHRERERERERERVAKQMTITNITSKHNGGCQIRHKHINAGRPDVTSNKLLRRI